MREIKFSGEYIKLHNQTSATLIQVNFTQIDKDTPQELIDYDTTRLDGSKYLLEDNYYMQLIFLGNLVIPFSTLRKMRYEKMKYYVSNINKEFEIKIIEVK